MPKLTIKHDTWPLNRPFTISRGSRTEAHTITVELDNGTHKGRGECVPYARYGETLDSVTAEIEAIRDELDDELDDKPNSGCKHADLLTLLPAGAARNAVDCALWDLGAKAANCRIWDLVGLSEPKPTVTAATISLDSPTAMGQAALNYARRPLLKVKLDGEQILERIRAVHENAPKASLIVDANEAWDIKTLRMMANALEELGVRMIEQPLPAGEDQELSSYHGPIPLCADESSHTAADLEGLKDRYQMVNVKLDKTGGLTEAFEFVRQAQKLDLDLMVGCMVGTSLAMAPAMLLTQGATFVDLDGPLWLAEDRDSPLDFSKSMVSAPKRTLWG